ncbi:MAG: helix-turn-helix domain-containing protein [Suipraeoptans sp.]
MKNNYYKKKDGFKNEQYFVIPMETFSDFKKNPLIKGLYLTDIGFFPNALHHYREREEGIEESILIYCMEGEGVVVIGNKQYIVRENQAFCIPANQKHKYYASEKNPWSIFWVHFKGDETKYYPINEKQVIDINSKPAEGRIVTLFDILFRVIKRNYTLGNFIYMSQVLSLILSEIYFREKVDEASKQNKHVTMIIRYMYKNLDKALNLDDLATEIGLSKSYINATFKKCTDKAPIDFFINLKMQEACKQLKATDKYVVEISQNLGYDDPYYFSRIFKKVVGVSPKEYRSGNYIQIQ